MTKEELRQEFETLHARILEDKDRLEHLIEEVSNGDTHYSTYDLKISVFDISHSLKAVCNFLFRLDK